MAETLLFLGGRRSGKSALAMRWAESHAASRILLATSRIRDPETAERVRLHKAGRDASLRVCEEEISVVERARAVCSEADCVLVIDCVSSWIANLLEDGFADCDILRRVQDLGLFCEKSRDPVALVSLEVGLGAVPMHALARRFSDVLGSANQILAASVGTVLFSVAGLPLPLKGICPACL
ncbi:MAG: bifunctional adenosylcobinamide kinase/adenosylcobinamide-phosphate guanylyltransferase [Desulfovibrionaceae bacterium]|nr:bifunctional adenosylcobinamide kinase/adenosylcobinamide-phosphate guanylyltransferase [Desulfovibrionaceae bacterium]